MITNYCIPGTVWELYIVGAFAIFGALSAGKFLEQAAEKLAEKINEKRGKNEK